jgi:outer membrane receptor protein involved in Fe transport
MIAIPRRRTTVCAASAFFVSICLQSTNVAAASEAIEEIVVTADFRGRPANDIPASITVIDAAEIEARAVQHFEELINYVPNLNWSGDGHRARYFQIRGVGELEQYQGAPNPSVGFLVDDIDVSGIGTIATLFDIERVEVLRGPQGTRYGANALAGLIYLQSAMPGAERNGRIQFQAGNDEMLAAGIAFGGALTADEQALYRLSAHQHRSNGFRYNSYLDKDDSNGRDETSLRGRLTSRPGTDWEINLAAFFADVDNGYDAFALDNSYTMLTDKPGSDAQQTTGASLRIDWNGKPGIILTSISSAASSDIDFAFDADWGNPQSWDPVLYDYITTSRRERDTVSQEFRLASDDSDGLDWLFGFYALKLGDDLDTRNSGEYYDPGYDFADGLDDRLVSEYEATSVALFGEIELVLGPATRLSLGLRLEQRSADYEDSSGLAAGPSESMSGGEVTLSHDYSSAMMTYVSLSKGYKAGGFNLGSVPQGRRDFASEALWNLEAGLKSLWFDDTLGLNASLFYSLRDDQQVRTSVQLVAGDPSSFVFYTDNAAKGQTIGLETELRWNPHPAWELFGNLGLLRATFEEYQAAAANLAGRDQPHAPRYNYAVGGTWRHATGWFARLDLSGKDTFYFDVSHDQKSKAFTIANARLGYTSENWTAEFWARNLFDEDYAVRGFYFGNEPPDFPDTLYTRPGDARQLGISLEWSF